MVSKFIVRSILVATLVFSMGTTAWATISGLSTTQLGCPSSTSSCSNYTTSRLCDFAKIGCTSICKACNVTNTQCSRCPRSIEVEGLLRGLGNVTNDPTAFAVTISIEGGVIVFVNPAGNADPANGVPFRNVDIILNSALPINANQVTKNGRAISDIVFHDAPMIAAVQTQLEANCANGDATACDTLDELRKANTNWVQFIVVTQLRVLGQQYSDPDTGTALCNLSPNSSGEITIDPTHCPLTDALGSQCTAPSEVVANPDQYAGVAFDYACTESCHNKTGTVCPTTLPLP